MPKTSEIPGFRATRRRKSIQLLGWSVGSIVVAAISIVAARHLDSSSRAFGNAVAVQFVIWGGIDLAFALMGVLQARHDEQRSSDEALISREAIERDKLIRTLRFNTKLNRLWLACGIVLLVSAGAATVRGAQAPNVASLLGHSLGVLVQAGFLTWFDRSFLRSLFGRQDAIV